MESLRRCASDVKDFGLAEGPAWVRPAMRAVASATPARLRVGVSCGFDTPAASNVGCGDAVQPTPWSKMNPNTTTARALYDAFAKGDVPTVLGGLASDIRWVEAAGGPYGGVSHGPMEVLANVFMKLGGEWDGFAAIPHKFVAEGDTVVALGDYSGTYKATGKSFSAPFAHVWQFQDGKVIAFQQHTDTVVHREPMK